MHRLTFRLFALSIASVAILVGLGCGDSEPRQQISFHDGRLNIGISEAWVLTRDSGKKAFYRYGDSKDVKLSFEDQTRDYGAPLTLVGVRAAIGKEVNRANRGGADARLSYAGNAVISYDLLVKEGRKKFHTKNWIVAKPLGYSAVTRVWITLRVPAGQENTPEFQELAATLDKQVGDAKIPEA